MRLPRFVIAGVLLFAAVFLLGALFAQPPFRAVGAVAAGVFLPLWYTVSAVNGWLGVRQAGYKPTEEAIAFLPVFGVPAGVCGLVWWASAGQEMTDWTRTPLFVAAGLMLWGAVALLAGLLGQAEGAQRFAAAAVLFLPLWVLICVTNLLVGVVAAGYGVLEELPILLVDLALPAAVALAGWRLARSA
jgi:hypothetical protein